MGCAASSQAGAIAGHHEQVQAKKQQHTRKRSRVERRSTRLWSAAGGQGTLQFLLVDDERGEQKSSSTQAFLQQVTQGLCERYPGTPIHHGEKRTNNNNNLFLDPASSNSNDMNTASNSFNNDCWSSQQTAFSVYETRFELTQVAGVRYNERHWMDSFRKADAVVFCVSLAGFDETCVTQDGRTCNRIMLALERFRLLSKRRMFANKPFLIFFLDQDDFGHKLSQTNNDLSEYEIFRDYRGRVDFQSAVMHIGQRFEACAADSGLLRETFMHLVHEPESTWDAFLDQTKTICMASELVRSGFIKLEDALDDDDDDDDDEDPTWALDSQGGSHRSIPAYISWEQ